MGELQLYNSIRAAREDKKYLSELLNVFNPLLKKYAYLLSYENALDDLRGDFVKLINNIDLADMAEADDFTLLSYIRKSVYDSYLKKSGKSKQMEHYVRNCYFCEMAEECLAANLSHHAAHKLYKQISETSKGGERHKY